MDVEQGADEDQDHLVVDFLDVVPDTEDDSAHLPCNGDGVLGVVHAVYLGLALSDKLPVDDARLDLVAETNEEARVSEGLVLEGSDLAILNEPVGPLGEVLLGLGPNQFQVVALNQLPDHGQDVLLVLVQDVRASNSSRDHRVC